MDTNLTGKTALITGAGKRIGYAIAMALAEEGVNLVLHYNRSAKEAEKLAKEIKSQKVNVWLIQSDFDKPDEVDSLIPRSMSLSGTLDILINSASIFKNNTIENVDYQSLSQHIQVNAWTPFILSRDFANTVNSGKIINLLDTRIQSYDFNHVAYILSKNMLATLTRMMAIEFAPKITVNGIAPGLILPPPGQDQEYLDKLIDTVPLKKHGDPQDIAAAVVYLLKSDFITGQIINVDGGRHLRT
ncbi:MAG: SDR family oxidoreductase [bacterium]